MVTLKNLRRYYRKEKQIPSWVLRNTSSKEIIYGSSALNARFPPWLDRATNDVDIYSKTPRKSAEKVERFIDKKMGFDAAKTKPALHPGTQKVQSNVTGRTISDHTQKPIKKIPYDTIKGHRYATLDYIKKRSKQILKDPESEYRHHKDRDTIQRIKIYRQYLKNKTRGKKKVASLW